MKIRSFLLAAIAATSVLVSCDKYDDGEIRENLAAIDNRVTALEGKVTSLEGAMSALQTVVDRNYSITGFEKTDNGYKLTFTTGETLELLNGEKGEKGDTGAQGIQGEKGEKGDTGATGAQGIQGEKGEKGDTGAQGEKGEKGDKGYTGATGPQGEKGEKGDDGDSFLQSITKDGSNIIIVLKDGTTYTIPCAIITIGSSTDFQAESIAVTSSASNSINIDIPSDISVASVTATVTHSNGIVSDTRASNDPLWTVSVVESPDGKYSVKVVVGEVTNGSTALLQIFVVKTDGTTYTASKKLTVKDPVKVTEITLDKTTAELTLGGTDAQKTTTLSVATVAPEDATDKSVTWSSSATGVATVDASTGVVTAVKAGAATITATAKDGSGKTATCAITVKQLVTSISLNKQTASVSVNGTETLTATVAPTDASDNSVSWSSSNTEVATVDQTGKVTGVAAGTATITATANDGSGKTATCTVTVTIKPITSIYLDYPTIIPIGHYSSNMSRVYPVDATNKELEWSSSNTAVATVDQTGKVTGKAAGTATITAKTKDGSNITTTRDITVKEITTVQLWADGPKFATENARFETNADNGQSWQWAMDAWGDAWTLLTVEQWNTLFTTDKVTKEWVEDPNNSGKYGFKFTGKESGYTSVSLFLPAKLGDASFGIANYWCATTGGAEQAKYVELVGFSHGHFRCDPYSSGRTNWYLVRLVLKN